MNTENYIKDERLTFENCQTAHTHYRMAFIGGFLGVYPVLNYENILGSAQTSNLIELVTDTLGGNLPHALLRILAMFLYMSAVALATYLPKHSHANLKYISLAIDGLAAILLPLIPRNLPMIIGLYPTFFAMAFQWCSFPGAYGYNSSSIFSTNNLRQFTSALVNVYCNHMPQERLKYHFYGFTLLCFHLGVAADYLLWRRMGRYCSLFALVPVGLTFYQLVRTSNRKTPYNSFQKSYGASC